MASRTILTNAIHHVVAVNNFSNDVDYKMIFQQSARLVSRLLRTPQAVHYFLAIIHASPHLTELNIDLTGTESKGITSSEIYRLLDRQTTMWWIRHCAKSRELSPGVYARWTATVIHPHFLDPPVLGASSRRAPGSISTCASIEA